MCSLCRCSCKHGACTDEMRATVCPALWSSHIASMATHTVDAAHCRNHMLHVFAAALLARLPIARHPFADTHRSQQRRFWWQPLCYRKTCQTPLLLLSPYQQVHRCRHDFGCTASDWESSHTLVTAIATDAASCSTNAALLQAAAAISLESRNTHIQRHPPGVVGIIFT
jgi:hypothetical protein